MSSANFAPYQPPPDEGLRSSAAASSSTSSSAPSAKRATNPADGARTAYDGKVHDALGSGSLQSDNPYEDDPRYATESYQSSTLQTPTHFSSSSNAGANGGWNQQAPAWAKGAPLSGSQPVRPPQANSSFGGGYGRLDDNQYSTAQGWSLSNLCFAAWGLPPFTSVLLLIYETENDLVRFHAYQAGTYGVGSIVLLWILRSWLGLYKISIIAGMAMLGYSWICGSNAANAAPTLTRSPFLPIVGPLAEQWVGEE